MKATFSQVRHPSHPGHGCGSLTCHMTHFEQSDWLRSPNLTNIMIEYIIITKFICGWCQAICSKLRCQMLEFPLCLPNIPNFWPVVYMEGKGLYNVYRYPLAWKTRLDFTNDSLILPIQFNINNSPNCCYQEIIFLSPASLSIHLCSVDI